MLSRFNPFISDINPRITSIFLFCIIVKPWKSCWQLEQFLARDRLHNAQRCAAYAHARAHIHTHVRIVITLISKNRHEMVPIHLCIHADRTILRGRLLSGRGCWHNQKHDRLFHGSDAYARTVANISTVRDLRGFEIFEILLSRVSYRRFRGDFVIPRNSSDYSVLSLIAKLSLTEAHDFIGNHSGEANASFALRERLVAEALVNFNPADCRPAAVVLFVRSIYHTPHFGAE